MSEASARRLVDRALSGGAPRDEKPDAADPTGRFALIRGAFFLSAGIVITAVTYLIAEPGGTYVVTYGLVIAGLAAFAHGWNRWSKTRPPEFPTAGVLVALLLPAVLGASVVLWKSRPAWVEAWSTAATRAEEAERRVRAAEESKRAADHQMAMREAVTITAQAREAANARTKLFHPEATVRCDGARFFELSKVRTSDDQLLKLLETDFDLDVRRCALDALVAGGGTRELLPRLDRMVKSDEYGRDVAIYGLAKIADGGRDEDRGRAALMLEQLQR